MEELANKRCLPCEGGISPFNKEKAQAYLQKLEGWELINEGKIIRQEFKFKNF